VEAPARIRANLQKLLRELGQYDRNQPIGIKELAATAWKETAAELLDQLTGSAPATAWDEFDELILVPDGPLWYLPFEALQIRQGDQYVSLIEKVRLRYAPTLSLTVPDTRPRKRLGRTAVVAGTIFPRALDTAADELFDRLRESDPLVFGTSVKIPPGTPLPLQTVDRLLVLNDLNNDAKGPYDWSPLGPDRGAAAGLEQWMRLPWGAPDELVLPGFHTPAEAALKRGGTGDEIFLSACALMAGGSRTILLSRWRDGGRTSYDLMREFVRELPHRTAGEAWQRSVQMAMSTDLDVEREPRVRVTAPETALRAKHPFFWSGYLLIDTGVEPK
jgi:CHAT domain-containing protein